MSYSYTQVEGNVQNAKNYTPSFRNQSQYELCCPKLTGMVKNTYSTDPEYIRFTQHMYTLNAHA